MWRSAQNVRNTMGSEAMVVRLRLQCCGRQTTKGQNVERRHHIVLFGYLGDDNTRLVQFTTRHNEPVITVLTR